MVKQVAIACIQRPKVLVDKSKKAKPWSVEVPRTVQVDCAQTSKAATDFDTSLPREGEEIDLGCLLRHRQKLCNEGPRAAAEPPPGDPRSSACRPASGLAWGPPHCKVFSAGRIPAAGLT